MGRKFKDIAFNEKLAKKLREIRESKQLTRQTVSKKLMLHENSIMNHESGIYCHEVYTIMSYCKFYELNISEFLEGIEV